MIEFAVNFSPGAYLDVNMGQVMEVYATEERTVELSVLSKISIDDLPVWNDLDWSLCI